MTRALIVVPVIGRRDERHVDGEGRSAEARLEEAVGLASAIELDIAATEIVTVNPVRPATLIGSGKIDELSAAIKEKSIELAIFDHPLTPVQQRNLETALGVKVLDRTGLILEIFGERARTKEGVIQVELAHLNYQKGRLVRSWTHLERQRGGAGFLGGPGETQIEADRRLLQERIQRLKRELETVKRTRELHRAKRKKIPFPVVAIVGYTNAGKSTLFNRLTGAGVTAKDMLFATLDPTLRRVRMPHGTEIILSDTVGFISDLPTHLVAAFRATLEEVVEADVILHVRDIADPDTQAQADDVSKILSDLGVNAHDPERVIEVWNKIDLLDDDNRNSLQLRMPEEQGAQATIPISAITGQGLESLRSAIENLLSGAVETVIVHIAPRDQDLASWIYTHGDVISRTDNDDGSAELSVRSTAASIETIRNKVSNLKIGANSGDRSRIVPMADG